MFFDEIGRMLNMASPELVLPRVTLIGRGAVCVEGHKGIMLFNGAEVRLRVAGGSLKVTGEELTVKNLSTDGALVSGKISAVEYE